MIKPVSEFIDAAKSQCKCVTADEARNLIQQNPDATIIDVREPKEAEESKLSKSVNIPRGLLEMKIGDLCPDATQPILVHCGAGGRASMAAARLQEMGYTNVHVIDAKFVDIKQTLDD